MNIDESRFWEKVDIPHGGFGCWEWQAADRGNGYGAFKVNGETFGAHRIAWALVYGGIHDGDTCHHCDNRSCVNPSHLFAGTRSDNMKDAAEKGRLEPTISPKRKLSTSQVRDIRGRLNKGEKPPSIADDFPVSPRTIRGIRRGDVYAYV